MIVGVDVTLVLRTVDVIAVVLILISLKTKKNVLHRLIAEVATPQLLLQNLLIYVRNAHQAVQLVLELLIVLHVLIPHSSLKTKKNVWQRVLVLMATLRLAQLLRYARNVERALKVVVLIVIVLTVSIMSTLLGKENARALEVICSVELPSSSLY